MSPPYSSLLIFLGNKPPAPCGANEKGPQDGANEIEPQGGANEIGPQDGANELGPQDGANEKGPQEINMFGALLFAGRSLGSPGRGFTSPWDKRSECYVTQ